MKYKDQPRVLYLSFITAMCERFGYYIIGFLLTLYLKNFYNYSDSKAFSLFALFTALGYLTPAIGGWLADNVIGIKRCLGLGLFLEACGYIFMAIPSSNALFFRIGLGAIIVGAGIFKTAPTNILGRSYDENDPRIDSGFTLYYMGINIGSLISSLVAGTIRESYGWHAPFVFAAGGLFLGLVWFFFFKHHANEYESAAGKKSFSLSKWVITVVVSIASVILFAFLLLHQVIADIGFYIGSAAVVLYFLYEIIVSPKSEKSRILVCLLLIFMAVIFFILYFQLYTSMELFIERNVDRQIFGFELPTVYYLGLNGLWIILLSPIFAFVYKSLSRRGGGISITTKFPMGILLISLCFFSLMIACNHFASSKGLISSWWMVLAIFLYSAGELLTSALGVAMITRIAPERMYGIMMGAWYLIATALAANLSGIVAEMASVPESMQNNIHATLSIYSGAFFKMGIIGAIAALVGLIVSPWLRKTANIQ